MKTIYYYISLLLSFSAFITFSLLSQNQADPNNPNNRVLQSSGDVNLPSNFVNINNMFILHFDFTSDNYIIMAIQFTIPDQYFSIGFGKQMGNSDMWIFELVNSEIVATDAVGAGYAPPPSDTTVGGTNDLQTLGYEITPTYSLVKVKRALNTGDPNDAVLEQGLTDIIWATGPSPTMMYHGVAGRGAVVVPLIAGAKASVQDDSSEVTAQIYQAHSLVSVIVWGAVVDIAILIVRFFRGTNLKIWKFSISVQAIHGILMMGVIGCSVAVTVLILKNNRNERGANLSHEPDKDFHFINGLIMCFFILLTVVLGLIDYLLLISHNKKRQLAVKSLHRVVGIILYVCAKANIITGAMIYNEGAWQVPVFASQGTLLAIHITLQGLYSYKLYFANKSSLTAPGPSKRSTHIALVQAINKGIPHEDIIAAFPQLKWVLLGSRVYDLTDWVHPGGNFLIEACIGREVGRYFFGNIALEGSKIAPHKHSALTVSQMQKFCIGEVTNCESVLVWKGGEGEAVSWPTNKWRIASTTTVSTTVSEIRFECPNLQVKNFGTSLSWLGRHYRLSHDTDSSLARLYTTAFSLTENNYKLRQSIYRYFEDVMDGVQNPVFAYDSKYLLPQDSLPLYIKNYPHTPRGFADLVHKTDIGHHSNKFRVEGPSGRGLELTPDSTGTHCIICAGTGILPFVDFLSMFLWKTMYTLIKKKAGSEKAEKINILRIPFDTFFNDMDIVFIGAFPNQKEVLGLDIITKLAEISQKYSINNFRAMMKGYFDANITEVQESFSSEFFSKGITLREERYYVVGPPKFNERVPRELEEIDVPSEKIMLI